MKLRKMVRVFVVFLLIVAGYHLTGIESAFCQDTNLMSASEHGCEICQLGHHVAVTFENQISDLRLVPLNFSLVNYPQPYTEEFSSHFFRPPIFL